MAENMRKNTAAKKAAATTKKTAAKTAATKSATPAVRGGTTARTSAPVNTDAPAATRVDDRAPDSEPIPSTTPVVPTDDSIEKVAAQVLRNSRRWGTGRERDIRLAKAGYDLDAVRREVRRQRGAAQTQNS